VQENTQLTAVVSGRVIETKLEKNNQNIQRRNAPNSNRRTTRHSKNLQSNQSADYQAQLSDLQKVSNGNFTGLQTGQYIREVSAMQEKIAQVQSQLSLAKKRL
jgi:HlyD family secretion protein